MDLCLGSHDCQGYGEGIGRRESFEQKPVVQQKRMVGMTDLYTTWSSATAISPSGTLRTGLGNVDSNGPTVLLLKVAEQSRWLSGWPYPVEYPEVFAQFMMWTSRVSAGESAMVPGLCSKHAGGSTCTLPLTQGMHQP